MITITKMMITSTPMMMPMTLRFMAASSSGSCGHWPRDVYDVNLQPQDQQYRCFTEGAGWLVRSMRQGCGTRTTQRSARTATGQRLIFSAVARL
jgi:hypothetical protein